MIPGNAAGMLSENWSGIPPFLREALGAGVGGRTGRFSPNPGLGRAGRGGKKGTEFLRQKKEGGGPVVYHGVEDKGPRPGGKTPEVKKIHCHRPTRGK